MTLCMFNGLTKGKTEQPMPEEQLDAALHNNRAYFDDWTAARPSSEWPDRQASSSPERAAIGGVTIGQPIVPPPQR